MQRPGESVISGGRTYQPAGASGLQGHQVISNVRQQNQRDRQQHIAANAPLPPPRAPSFEDIVGPMQGGGGASSFGMSTSAGLGALGEAQARAAQALGALDAQYEARKEELRADYQLTETEEERASIQHLLAVIEAQREAGTKVIERVYGEAITDAAARADEVRAQGGEARERTAETFQEAAEESSALLQELNQSFGGAMGAASRPLSDVAEGAIANMLQQGQIEGAFDERMFGITADDIATLGEAMRPEMAAQVGGLQRIAAQTSAAGQAQHSMEVNRRIAQERANMQAAMAQLAGQFDQRRFGLEDQQISLMAQAAQMQAENARQAASLRASSAAQRQQLTPAQEWALRQAEAEHAAALEMHNRENELRRQNRAFTEFGANLRDSRLATALGLGQQFAGQLLQPVDQLAQLLGP